MLTTEKVWERFYTDAKTQNKEESFVDQISIDAINKVYVLYEQVDYEAIDGWDEKGNEIYSFYISREVFNIILKCLKSKGYKQVKK